MKRWIWSVSVTYSWFDVFLIDEKIKLNGWERMNRAHKIGVVRLMMTQSNRLV